MVIRVNVHIGRCYSNDDGSIIYNLILPLLRQGKNISVSFDGIDSVTSSFVNSAFLVLLDHFDFDFIKTHISFVHSTKQINDMIRDRFIFEVKKRDQLTTV